ncbi:MAG: hypothetical protein Q8P44_00855 [Dehalococcoidia bacterium]|nr:hypothetical protein [Dehalococcoidia bacterium]
MKPKKPDKSISGMDVLKDIRGLLSASREPGTTIEPPSQEENRLKNELTGLREHVRVYQETVQKQQEQIRKMEREYKDITAELDGYKKTAVRPLNQTAQVAELREDVEQLEARKAELTSAVSGIEELLHLKVKELLKRIVRLYQESGQSDIALDIRRTGNALDDVDNFARFLRELIQQ